MTGGRGDRYTLDADELAAIVGELIACRATLDRNVADLRRQMAVLQSEWEGVSADAQSVAQEELDAGMAAMNLALGDLIDANDLAHRNYTGAWQANVDLWRTVQ